MSPEFHDFEHTAEVFSPHHEPDGWTGHDLVTEFGFFEPRSAAVVRDPSPR
jgi:hypothetical protein